MSGNYVFNLPEAHKTLVELLDITWTVAVNNCLCLFFQINNLTTLNIGLNISFNLFYLKKGKDRMRSKFLLVAFFILSVKTGFVLIVFCLGTDNYLDS